MDDTERASARRIGLLAQDLVGGYSAFLAAGEVFDHPGTKTVLDAIERENVGPAVVAGREIQRLDGTSHYYALAHYADVAATSSGYREVRDRLWPAGALLALGDALADVQYLDRAPDLEFVRHLRNGVAHGNRFHLRGTEPKRPAHFSGPDRRGRPDGSTTERGRQTYFEIVPELNGKAVLFEFLGPGDLADLLLHLSWRLIRIGNGDPPQDLWPQRGITAK